MSVMKIKTEARCKICTHARRDEIDTLLEHRSLRHWIDSGGFPVDKDVEGAIRVNREYIIARLKEWDLANPTVDNIQNHWKKHCSLVDNAQAAHLDELQANVAKEKERIFIRILGPDRRSKTPTVDEVLEVNRAVYVFEQEERAKLGLPSGLTHDHFHKGADTTTKRKQEDAMSAFLGSLGQGLGKALVQGPEQKALPEGEIIVETVEEADVIEGVQPDSTDST